MQRWRRIVGDGIVNNATIAASRENPGDRHYAKVNLPNSDLARIESNADQLKPRWLLRTAIQEQQTLMSSNIARLSMLQMKILWTKKHNSICHGTKRRQICVQTIKFKDTNSSWKCRWILYEADHLQRKM